VRRMASTTRFELRKTGAQLLAGLLLRPARTN
jgi:hypothetical protein